MQNSRFNISDNGASLVAMQDWLLFGGKRPSEVTAIYTPDAGDMVDHCCEEVARFSNIHQIDVLMSFNDWTYTAQPGQTGLELTKLYNEFRKEQSRKWQESDEGKEYLRKLKEQGKQRDVKYTSLMKKWPKWQDFGSVLQWCAELEKTGFNIKDREKILNEFKSVGFSQDMNLGKFFKEDSRENYANYLIGQVLSGIQKGAIPQVFQHFYSEWKTKFEVQ